MYCIFPKMGGSRSAVGGCCDRPESLRFLSFEFGWAGIWFYFDASTKQFVCASHERSKLIRVLEKVDRCGFEIATNDSPYRGIRGKAVATLGRANVDTSLRRLVDRYLGSTNAGLGQWLLSRVDEEYEIRLTPTWMTAWDYGQRMDPIAG